ncbi:conserved oligomeric Golgi complex subunit 2-like [Bolinopsis microptera]|uniref:conserved oligomeric Golgi complex subunit 2-like n=1 Tax=Bolinopsis microptera TaxID=2820187 RepID=UPI003078EE89
MSLIETETVESPRLLLSKLKRERPVCFRPEEFFEDNFDVDTFLALNRKSFTLESLKKDLENYSTTIQNSLVELINRDYADFVNLSTNLVGVDQTILKLEAPLIDIHADINIISQSIDSEVQLIAEKLQLRSQIRNKEEILHGLMNIEKLTNKIEQLIDNQTEGKESLFERVASEYSQLQFYVNKNENLPFVQNMRPRIKRISDYLEGGLHKSFKSGLKNNDKNSVTQCLRIFTTLGRVDQSEQLFADAIIAPIIEEIVCKQNLSESGLEGMYCQILDALPAATALVLSLTSPRKDNELRSFDFMSNATFPTIVSKICTNTPALFAAGDPKQFQKSYKETMKFISGFEKLCQYKERVANLRQHPSYKNFISKWSLPIYFQIRLQEIAGSFEHQLLSPFTFNTDRQSETSTSQTGVKYALPVSVMLELCINRCWEEDVLLKPLTHRFFKLTLQLLRRYAVWLSEIPTSSEELIVSDICKAVHDSYLIVDQVPNFVKKLTSDKIPVFDQTEILSISCKDILDSIPVLADYVINDVIKHCEKALEQTQAVPRLFRRTNREMPTEPLGYVSQLIGPIETDIYNSVLPDIVRQEWCSKTAHQLVTRYSETVAEILISLRKTEDSLAMLKRGRKSAAQTASTTNSCTDEDKIRAQLKLDVTELGAKLDIMGIPKGEEFEKLQNLVAKR